MFGRAALVGLVAVAACGGPIPAGGHPVPFCKAQHPTPLANLGPDLHLRAPCGGAASGVVASISELGNGVFNWSASIAGDPALQLDGESGPMCSGTNKPVNMPDLASVRFNPPLTARPGDTFDAVVTISAGDDVFSTGTVNVHAEVVTPTVTVDRSAIDFGDVSLDDRPDEMLIFQNETPAPIIVVAPVATPPFVFDPADKGIAPGERSMRVVGVFGNAPGDASMVTVWTTTARPDLQLPEGCTGSLSVTVHARLVAPDGGATD